MKITPMPVIAGTLFLVLTGCAGSMPMTAAEYRDAAQKSMFTKIESFEVNRNFRDVGKTFEEHADRCFNVTITSTDRANGAPMSYNTYYKPTVLIGDDRAELHLQQKQRASSKAYKEPEDGIYVLVADATPLAKNKSRVDIYAPKIGQSVTIQAVKNWAQGKKGCPDLTKNLN